MFQFQEETARALLCFVGITPKGYETTLDIKVLEESLVRKGFDGGVKSLLRAVEELRNGLSLGGEINVVINKTSATITLGNRALAATRLIPGSLRKH